jgi:tetratricopeptide (TPR) repeat protein
MRKNIAKSLFVAGPFVASVIALSFGASALVSMEAAAEAGDSTSARYLSARHARFHQDTSMAARLYVKLLADDPEDTRLMRAAFLSLVSDGQVGEAVGIARRLTKKNPRAGLANTVIALDQIKNGDHQAAGKTLSKASRSRFYALLVPLAEAWSRAGEKRYDDALTSLKSLNKRKAYKLFQSYHLALIDDLAGRPETAEAAYRNTLGERDGYSLRVVEVYGNFLERQGRRDEALKIYGEYLETDPENPLILNAVARAVEGGKAEAIIKDARDGAAEAFYGAAFALAPENAFESAQLYVRLALYLKPDFPAAQSLLGGIHEGQRRWLEANKVYSRIDPDSAYGWNARIRQAANFDRLDQTDESARLLRKLAADFPQRTDALVKLGDIFRVRKRFDESVEVYTVAMSRIPQPRRRDWTLYYSRGIAYEQTKRWEEAEADFLYALELRPDQPLVLNYLGYSWIEKGLHIKRAQLMIEKAVEMRPTDGYIVDSLGWVLYILKDYKGAVKKLERAVSLRPEDPIINSHLGDALWRYGRHLEAGFQWRHSIVLNPTDELLKELKIKIEKGLDAVEGDAK